jgi:integrase
MRHPREVPDQAVPAAPRSTGESLEARIKSWNREIERFLRNKRAEASIGELWLRRIGYELRRLPSLLTRFGEEQPPQSAKEVSSHHLELIRNRVDWGRCALSVHFAAIKSFLKWGGNPLVNIPGCWRLPTGESTHRRWLSKEQLGRLFGAAIGSERILVALEGFNGLRRIEVLRLRTCDVLLVEDCLRVLGKGRSGGKWRKIPLHPVVRKVLADRIVNLPGNGRVVPVSATSADNLLTRAAVRSGLSPSIKVSHHDLRRTFGRLAREAGMDIVQLQQLFGHASLNMTAHYIGFDTDRMREGLLLYAQYLQ